MDMSDHIEAHATLPPYITSMEGWVNPRHSMNDMEKIRTSFAYKESNPDSLVIQPVYQLLY
jgi:hypothetical protein